MHDPTPHRPRCYRCMRPVCLCLCDGLPSVTTRTEVVILQHPHERKHPFGTARLTALCLPRARLHVANGGLHGPLLCPLDLPADAAVLYPHPHAADLADLPPAERPSTLLVLDGTWAHSRKLHRENPWLQELRHVRLRPQQPSRYRIRREPKPEYVSTLEAIVAALQILEPGTEGLDRLVAAFDRMIDRQVARAGKGQPRGRSRHARPRPSRALPALLDDPRLVVAYAESSLQGGDVAAPRELVHWVAARLDGDDTFEAVIRPAGPGPSPHHLAHMGISPAAFADALQLAAARDAFQRWLGEAPVAAWTQSSLDWGRALIGADTPTCVLKTAYTNLRNRGAGLLDAVVEREGLTAPSNTCRGRAALRLGNALAVARWLRTQRCAAAMVTAGNREDPCS